MPASEEDNAAPMVPDESANAAVYGLNVKILSVEMDETNQMCSVRGWGPKSGWGSVAHILQQEIGTYQQVYLIRIYVMQCNICTRRWCLSNNENQPKRYSLVQTYAV